LEGGAETSDLKASLVAVGVSDVRQGCVAGAVPPSETAGGGGGLRGEDVVGGGSEITKELGGSFVEGRGVRDEGEGVRAKVGGPRITKERVNLPTRGSGKGRGVVGGGDGEKEPGVVRPDRVVKRDRALRRIGGVGEERLIDKDMVNEGGARTRQTVGDGTLRNGGNQSRSIKPLLKLVVPVRGRNVWRGPKGGVGIEVPPE